MFRLMVFCLFTHNAKLRFYNVFKLSCILTRNGQKRLQNIVAQEIPVCETHCADIESDHPARCATDWTPVDKRGRPKKTWRSTFCKDMRTIGSQLTGARWRR